MSGWTGEFERLSKDLVFSVDALFYGRVSYENHAEVWPTLEVGTGGSFSRTLLEIGILGLSYAPAS